MAASIFTDGGSRGNPGPSAAAWLILDSRGRTLACAGQYLPSATNNLAEYTAIIGGLTDALHLQLTDVILYTDSLLAVHQLTLQCRTYSSILRSYANSARALLARFRSAHIIHIPRATNAAADALVNQILDAHTPSSPGIRTCLDLPPADPHDDPPRRASQHATPHQEDHH